MIRSAPYDMPLVSAILIGLTFGALIVPFKMIYSFLPLFNLIDIAVFGVVGFLLGRWSGRRWAAAAALALPTVLLCAYFLTRLGADLLAGVGLGWALAAVLVPASAFAGMAYGASSVAGT
jgi:hypothetical protein